MTPNDLIEAARNMKIVSLTYVKKNGEVVDHIGGIYEIGENKAGREVIWLWDTERNDTIRQFFPESIMNYQITDQDFIRPNPWPIKIYGEIVVP